MNDKLTAAVLKRKVNMLLSESQQELGIEGDDTGAPMGTFGCAALYPTVLV